MTITTPETPEGTTVPTPAPATVPVEVPAATAAEVPVALATAAPPAPPAAALAAPSVVTLSVRTEFPLVQSGLTAEQRLIVLANLIAPDVPFAAERSKPLRFSAAIDLSGSMRGEKLRLAKESLNFIIDELRPTDEFGIVAFESSVFEVFAMSFMTAENKERARIAVARVREMGCTNLSGGLFMGIQQVQGEAAAAVVPSKRVDPVDELFGRAAQLPQPLEIIVKHQHTAVSRDGRKKHAYWMQLAVKSPAGAAVVFSVTAAGSAAPKHGNDLAFDLCDAPVPAFMITVKPAGVATAHGVTIVHALTEETHDEGVAEYLISGGVAKAVNSPASVSDGEPAPVATANAEVPKPVAPSRAVLLFTDGQANNGITDTDQLVHETQRRLSQRGSLDITVYTFGFGESHNSNMLRRLAEVTQGSYYFIENASAMKEAFADCLGGLVSIVATDIKVTFEVDSSFATIDRVMTQYPTTGAGNKREVMLKDLFASERRDLLLSVAFKPELAVAEKVDFVTVTISYENCAAAAKSGSSRVTAQAIGAVAVAAEAYAGKPDMHVDEQRNRVQIAEALAAARDAADSNDRDKARAIITSTMNLVTSSATCSAPTVQMMSGQMHETLELMASAATWQREGTKKASSYAAQHMQQRCAVASSAAPSADAFDMMYSNMAKRELRKKVAK